MTAASDPDFERLDAVIVRIVARLNCRRHVRRQRRRMASSPGAVAPPETEMKLERKRHA